MFEALGGNAPAVPTVGSATVRAGDDWRESGTAGFLVRPLLEDAEQGLRTWLMKVEPGASAALHAHEEIEQVYVLSGEFSDGESRYGPGDFVMRAPGAPHVTACERGAQILVIYAAARGGRCDA